LIKIAEWLKTGISTGRVQKPRMLEAAAGIENLLRAMGKMELNSDDALRIVQALKNRKLIDITAVKSGKGAVSFTGFLEEFWDYKASPYVREKLAHGQSIGKRHCYESMSRLNHYWRSAFHGRALNNITRQDLKDFSLSLADGGLASASINKVMAVGTTCLSWAFREGLIPADPTLGLVSFSGEAKKRGVLMPLEAQALFSAWWKDKRAYVASLLAFTTGMRSGEVLALKLEDIEERVLNDRHSWSAYDGLKMPKSGESRKVPLYPEVRGALLELAADSPHGPGRFIFYGSTLTDKPVDRSVLLDGLHVARIGVSHTLSSAPLTFFGEAGVVYSYFTDITDDEYNYYHPAGGSARLPAEGEYHTATAFILTLGFKVFRGSLYRVKALLVSTPEQAPQRPCVPLLQQGEPRGCSRF
jgi:hypothetical protein